MTAPSHELDNWNIEADAMRLSGLTVPHFDRIDECDKLFVDCLVILLHLHPCFRDLVGSEPTSQSPVLAAYLPR